MKYFSHGIITSLMISFVTMSLNAQTTSVSSGVTFTNVSDAINFQRQLGEGLVGVAWLDYDADHDLDILITNSNGFKNGLFRNDGDEKFVDVSTEAGLSSLSGNSAVVVGDIDNDGYPDIFLSGTGGFVGPLQSPTKIYHNNGDGSFTDISDTANVPGAESALSAAMADINNDGYLDLFVTSPGHLGMLFPPATQHTDRLYLNNGNLTFTDITESAGVLGGLGSCVASFSDYNNDNLIDLFVGVCNDVTFQPTPLHLYRNNGDNTFTDVAALAGLDKLGYWMALAFGDIDNDGDFDLFATSTPLLNSLNNHILFRNNGDGTYTDITPSDITNSEFSWGATFVDFDNDTYVDLFYGGSLPAFGVIGPGLANPGRLFFNDGQGALIQNNAAHGLDLTNEYVTGIAQADFDNNGFPDFLIATSKYTVPDPVTGLPIVQGSGAPILMQNNANYNHWITIELKGINSNRMGIGARIDAYTIENGIKHQVREIRAGSSFASTETPWPTFGLAAESFTIIKISWPSGLIEWYPIFEVNKKYKFVEASGNSISKRP
ncbi:hypothetical protein MNBD_GAMMA22-46 [hydrothermal vent metagenome]|uniref:ASPIC/UnbV domain-containing protein n=1 Tax=hydrothermal vent metagenome TaxID=652676 RepID=A0A3B0ZUF5_9ZZZZ